MTLSFGGETEAWCKAELCSLAQEHAEASVTISGLAYVGKNLLGLGWGNVQGTSIPLLGSPQCAVSGCRRLFCARRLARGGGSSALMLLLGYLGTSNSVSCLVEGMFSYQVLLWSTQIPPLASQTPHFQAVPGRWSLAGPWELPLFSQRCREKKSLVSFYFSEGETERAAKVEAFPREL